MFGDFFNQIWDELLLILHVVLTDSELIYLAILINTSLLWKFWPDFAVVGMLGLDSQGKHAFLKGLCSFSATYPLAELNSFSSPFHQPIHLFQRNPNT